MKSGVDVRKLVTDKFNEWIESSTKPESVAVVGGDSAEPELQLLSDSTITFYGIENTNNDHRFRKLDLNSDLPNNTAHETFDLVLCSQVVEHLYDVPKALKTIASLVKPGGHVWLGFPSSNFPHGSPEYYSAGYPFQTVAKLLPFEFELVISGQIGSKRNYLWTHTLREWPSLDELNHPIRFIWKTPVSLPRKVVRTVRRLRQAHVVFSNNETSHEIEWATESYLLAKRNVI
jgi:SAM-dependent methyltransferase